MIKKYFENGWQVWRWEETENDWGEPSKKWVKHLDIEGRMRPLSGDNQIRADKETPIADHKFYCSPADIKAGDKLKKSDDTYHVEFVQDVMHFDRLLQTECRKLPETEREEYEEE